jgi:hypothetical protein
VHPKDLEVSAKHGDERRQHVEQLSEVIEKKISTYDPTKTGMDSEYLHGERMSLNSLVRKYSDSSYYCMFIVGCIAAMLMGSSLPVMMLFFGEFTDSIGSSVNENANGFDSLDKQVMLMVYIALATMIVSGV